MLSARSDSLISPEGGIIRFDGGSNLYQPSAKAHLSNSMNSLAQNVIKYKLGLLNLAAELNIVPRTGRFLAKNLSITRRASDRSG